MNNNNNKLPTEEEKITIIKCIEKTGELYRLFGLNTLENEPTSDDIKREFYNRVRNLDPNADSKILEQLREAYDILSNQRLREIYNLYFLQVVVQNEYKQIMIIKNSVTTVLAVGAYALERTNGLVASKIGYVDPFIQVGKEIYKNSGVLGFYRGYVVSALSVLPEQVIRQSIVNLVDAFMVHDNFQSIPLYENIRSLVKSTIYSIISSPSKFIVECIWMSPYSYSMLQVIRKVILREQIVELGNGITKSQFNYKNIFYAFGSTLLLRIASELVFHLTGSIERIIQDQYNRNQNSSFWKYTSLLYNNIIFQGTLNAILVSPFEVARLQYSAEFVRSYVNGTPIPKAINPIQMIRKVINTQGVKKLYNGCSLLSTINSINIFTYFYNIAKL